MLYITFFMLFAKKTLKKFVSSSKSRNFALAIGKQRNTTLARHKKGAIAQLVEHRTENPCVPGSNPGGTTSKKLIISISFFC